eukprot:scaffold1333_cov86-Cylindrotheca_fusiformis.AAC.4
MRSHSLACLCLSCAFQLLWQSEHYKRREPWDNESSHNNIKAGGCGVRLNETKARNYQAKNLPSGQNSLRQNDVRTQF